MGKTDATGLGHPTENKEHQKGKKSNGANTKFSESESFYRSFCLKEYYYAQRIDS